MDRTKEAQTGPKMTMGLAIVGSPSCRPQEGCSQHHGGLVGGVGNLGWGLGSRVLHQVLERFSRQLRGRESKAELGWVLAEPKSFHRQKVVIDHKKPFRNTQVANEINITIYNTKIFAREIKYRLFKCPSTEESLNQNNPRLWNDMQYLSNIKFCIFQNRKRMFMIYFK